MVKKTANGRTARAMWGVLIFMALLLVFGCERVVPPPAVISPPALPPVFPPQEVMQSGDYKGFFEKNEEALKTCKASKGCEVALLNMGFLHAYSKSPFYDPQKAMRYFEQLTKEYPQTPQGFQAEAWLDLLKRGVTSQKGQYRLQEKLKTKDEKINDLQEQIQRSREIDQQIDQKEREIFR